MQLEIPAHFHCLLHTAMCSALCNESVIQYNPDKRCYEKIGESTEVALRVLAEKVGYNFISLIMASDEFTAAAVSSFQVMIKLPTIYAFLI